MGIPGGPQTSDYFVYSTSTIQCFRKKLNHLTNVRSCPVEDCVYIYIIYINMCVCIYPQGCSIPNTPKKISGCCPKSKKEYSHSHPLPNGCALRLRALQASTAVAPAAAYMVNEKTRTLWESHGIFVTEILYWKIILKGIVYIFWSIVFLGFCWESYGHILKGIPYGNRR